MLLLDSKSVPNRPSFCKFIYRKGSIPDCRDVFPEKNKEGQRRKRPSNVGPESKHGGVIMPRRKKQEEFAPKGEKDVWHPYELQSLARKRFLEIVGKILKGDYTLLDTSHCARTIEI
jgi:hypothetical protein